MLIEDGLEGMLTSEHGRGYKLICTCGHGVVSVREPGRGSGVRCICICKFTHFVDACFAASLDLPCRHAGRGGGGGWWKVVPALTIRFQPGAKLEQLGKGLEPRMIGQPAFFVAKRLLTSGFLVGHGCFYFIIFDVGLAGGRTCRRYF